MNPLDIIAKYYPVGSEGLEKIQSQQKLPCIYFNYNSMVTYGKVKFNIKYYKYEFNK